MWPRCFNSPEGIRILAFLRDKVLEQKPTIQLYKMIVSVIYLNNGRKNWNISFGESGISISHSIENIPSII